MEHRSAAEIIGLLEPLLRKHERDEGLRLSEAKETVACRLGDNFISNVFRVEVSGRRGNGSPYSRSLISKRFPGHRPLAKTFNTSGFFRNECHIYKEVLPLFGPFAPDCIHADNEEIILQDMKAAGYVVQEKKDLLDYEHCSLTLKTLAAYHAAGLALKIKDPDKFRKLADPLEEVVFRQDGPQVMTDWLKVAMSKAVSQLETIEPRTEDVKRAIECLNLYQQIAPATANKLIQAGGKKYHTILHGDLWNNNLIFKHDEQGQPCDVKLLDFQCARHTSVALDIHYMICTSAKPLMVEERYEELLNDYYEAFLEKLRQSKVPAEVIADLNMDWFKAELQEFSEYGLLTGVWLNNMILAESDEVFDLENLTEEMMEALKDNPPFVSTPLKLDKILRLCTHFLRNYGAGISYHNTKA